MRALLVYESLFGNTEAIARAVAKGLEQHIPVEVVEVGEAPDHVGEDVDLLVVGGPTHVFGLTRESTRESAVEQGAPGPVEGRIGLREWLDALSVPRTVPAAAFDTRVDRPKLPGTAGRAIEKRLNGLGLHLVAKPEHFAVHGTPGPLAEGEVERAARWGGELGATVAPPANAGG